MPRDLLAEKPPRQPRDLLEANPSVAEDVAKSGPSALARGTLDLVGLPGTIGDALNAGGQWALRKGYALATGEEPSPEGGAVERFFAGPTPEVEAAMIGGGQNPLGGANLKAVASAATGGATDYQPKTTLGKYVRTGAEFLPGALAFGGANPANLLRFGALPAVASETAGQLTEGTAAEPYARIGAALVAPAVPSLVRRAVTPLPISPDRAKMVDTLKREGVELTAGQSSGRQSLKYLESELGGGKLANMLDDQGTQFTAAALKRAGITADRATPDVIDDAFSRIGQQFDDLASQTRVPFDQKLQTDMLDAVVDYQSVSANTAPAVERVMNRAAELAQQNGGVLAGEAYKNLRSEIGHLTKRADGPTKMALRDLQEAIDDAVERHIPSSVSDAWQTTRNQYRNMLVLEQAATGAGENAAMGIISPSQLRNATVQKHGRRNYARGKGDYAELARAGEAIMKPLPQSGTAPRTAARNLGMGLSSALGAGGGAAVTGGSPMGAIIGALAGAAIPGGIGKAVLSRPVRAYLANQLTQAQPILDPKYAAVVSALLGQNVAAPASLKAP